LFGLWPSPRRSSPWRPALLPRRHRRRPARRPLRWLRHRCLPMRRRPSCAAARVASIMSAATAIAPVTGCAVTASRTAT